MRTLKYGCAMVLAVASVATAQDAALQDFSGGSAYDSYYGSTLGDVIGYTFVANADVYVTDLGCWIDTDGMQSIHEVGIWDMNGNLLAWTIVDPGTAWEYNSFNYQALDTALMLTDGESYVAGAMYRSGDSDSYISSASSATWDARVSFVESRYPLDMDFGFVMPELTSSSTGRFGPNMILSDIPGPGGLALLGLGLIGYRRRR